MTTPGNPADPGRGDFDDRDKRDQAEDLIAEAEAVLADAAVAGNGSDAGDETGAETGAETEADAAVEASASDADAEAAADAEAEPVSEVDKLKAELAERTEDLQRINAEYANFRRRTAGERTAIVDTTKAKVLEKFLPVLDDLQLARQHGDLEEGPLKAIADKIDSIVSGQDLVAFGEEGDAFDPEIHEAVQDLSDGGEQVLGTVLRRGYRVGDKLVRTAMVIIASPASE